MMIEDLKCQKIPIDKLKGVELMWYVSDWAGPFLEEVDKIIVESNAFNAYKESQGSDAKWSQGPDIVECSLWTICTVSQFLNCYE